jgi:hypothetical protein
MKGKNMNNKFDELTRSTVQGVTRRAALKKFTAGIALAALLALPAGAAETPQTSTVLDPAGDSVFPFDLYGGALVPPYLDPVRASVSYSRGVFHFEVQMNGKIPAHPTPDFTPSVNHLGATIGILIDRKTAYHFQLRGQTDNYYFNFLVGALYSFADSGVGLPLGWSGYVIDMATFTTVPIPMQIRGDTLGFEINPASLGSPTAFDWMLTIECDPVPVIEEDRHDSLLLLDYVPDHGYARWPAQ